MTTTVLRIEHPETRKGVYASAYYVVNEWLVDQGLPAGDAGGRHPSSDKDSLLQTELSAKHIDAWKDVRYGFKNMDQLRSWFFDNDIIEDLNDKDLVFSVYRIESYNDVAIGNSQVIFRDIYHNDASRLLSVPVIELNRSLKSDADIKVAIENPELIEIW